MQGQEVKRGEGKLKVASRGESVGKSLTGRIARSGKAGPVGCHGIGLRQARDHNDD